MLQEELPTPEFNSGEPPRGLVNMGNTCYLNAALQALAHCPSLVYYFRACVSLYHSADQGSEDVSALVMAFAKVLHQLGGEPSSPSADGAAVVVKPVELLKATADLLPHFQMNEQQDSQELLRALLDGIDEALKRPLSDEELIDYRERLRSQWKKDTELDWKDEAQAAYESQQETRAKEARERGDPPPPPPAPPRPYTSPIKQLFEGQLLSAVKCLNCEQVSYTRDAFLDLSLQMPAPRRNVRLAQPSPPSSTPPRIVCARHSHVAILLPQKRDSGRAFDTARLSPVHSFEEENGGRVSGGRHQPRKARP